MRINSAQAFVKKGNLGNGSSCPRYIITFYSGMHAGAIMIYVQKQNLANYEFNKWL